MAEEELLRRVDHVFLPRKLPGSQSKDLETHESFLLGHVSKVLTKSALAPLISKTTKQLFKTWAGIQADRVPNEEDISSALGQLATGNMFGYYVRAQNAAFLISIESSAEAIIATFPAALKADQIMSSVSVIGAYPEQAIRIPKSELLSSLPLARQIVTLTNHTFLDTLPTSPKAGIANAEIRDVPDTTYVSEWLTSTLCNSSSKLDTTFPTICKKIRDEVIWDNSLLPFRRSGMWTSIKVILQLSLLKSKKLPENDCLLIYKMILAEVMRQMCEEGERLSLNPDIGMHM